MSGKITDGPARLTAAGGLDRIFMEPYAVVTFLLSAAVLIIGYL
jgi:hypothetical protein